LAASLALAAAGVNFHADAFADPELVDVGSERCHRAHIFVAGREVLVEGQAAADARRRAAMDDLEIGGADRHRVDADQNFRAARNRRRFLAQQ
jgi:hypothetical protein